MESGDQATQLASLTKSSVLEELTRKNVGKALAFRKTVVVAAEPDAEDAAATPEGPIDESLLPPTPPTPASLFLDRAHEHYLRSIASFDLATAPLPDSERSIKQLTQRLNPSDRRGAPLPVETVPLAGRTAKAGERTDGWAVNQFEVVSKNGGPIGRAKGSRGREGRSESY